MVQMKKIRRLCQAFTDGANEINQKITSSLTDGAKEVNQKIISVIHRWWTRGKSEDYVNHLQEVQIK